MGFWRWRNLSRNRAIFVTIRLIYININQLTDTTIVGLPEAVAKCVKKYQKCM